MMLERDDVYNDILDRLSSLEALTQDLHEVSRPAEVVLVEQPEWQALAGWVSTGSVLRDVIGQIILDPATPMIQIAAGGYIQSDDFVGGSAGFQINGGTAEFNDVVVRGTVYAESGEIGGWSIGTYTLTADSGAVGLNSETTGGTDIRIWAGDTDPASAPFRVSEGGEIWATNAHITGEIDAESGHLGDLAIDGVVTIGTSAPYIQLDGPNKRIRASTYSAGLQGFSIEEDGTAEFANISVRGEIHAATMAYGEAHAIAGSLLVSKAAGKLKNDVTTAASPTTFNIDIEDPDIGHVQLFDTGDILQLKDGSGNDNWVSVSSVSDQTSFYRYVCTLESGSPAALHAGCVVVDYGASGDGLLTLTADATNAPYMVIETHTGSPWSTRLEKVRLGNLNGITDPTFGALSGFGLWTDNVYLTGKISATGGEISGMLDMGDGGEIRLGSGEPGTDFTGLRLYRSGSTYRLAGYDEDILQAYFDSDGILKAGNVSLKSDGISIDGSALDSAIKVKHLISGSLYASSYAYYQSSGGGALAGNQFVIKNAGAGYPIIRALDDEIIIGGAISPPSTAIGGGLAIGWEAYNISTLPPSVANQDCYVRRDCRFGGGIYVGDTGTDPDDDDIYFEGDLRPVRGGTAYIGQTVIETGFDYQATALSGFDSTTFTDMMAKTVTVPTGGGTLIVWANWTVEDDGSGSGDSKWRVRLKIDGTTYGEDSLWLRADNDTISGCLVGRQAEVSSGSHNIKVKIKRESGARKVDTSTQKNSITYILTV